MLLNYERLSPEVRARIGKVFPVEQRGANPRLAPRTKYRAIRDPADAAARAELNKSWPEFKGHTFDSKWERQRACQLVLALRVKVITELRFKPRCVLTRAKIVYIPDFRYVTEHGELVYEDTKGYEPEVWKLKAHLWEAYGWHRLVVSWKDGRRRVIEPRDVRMPYRRRDPVVDPEVGKPAYVKVNRSHAAAPEAGVADARQAPAVPVEKPDPAAGVA